MTIKLPVTAAGALLFASLIFLGACGKSKPEVPSLTPQQASTLLEFNNKAKDWLTFVKRNNAGCSYKLDLPDQSNHPAEIDLDHIVTCNDRPSPKEFDATVVFTYDPAQGRWIVGRFSS